MSDRPCVKGSVFSGVAEAVRALLASGRVSREESAHWLEPSDFELVDADLLVSSWYDVDSFARLNLLLRDIEGRGRDDYLRELGRQTAQRLLRAGLYSQLEYLQHTLHARETEPAARSEAFGRDLRRLTSMSASLYNFGSWTSSSDPRRPLRHRLTVTGAEPLADVLCLRAEGFINEMASWHDSPDLWRWQRERADLVRFEMVRDP